MATDLTEEPLALEQPLDSSFHDIPVITAVIDEALVHVLKEHNLYDDLYEILSENNLSLDTLKQLKPSEIDEICRNLQLNAIQTIKCRRLIQIIGRSKLAEGVEDIDLKQFVNHNHLPLEIYHILMSEEIEYDDLATLQPVDINNKLCDNHNVKVGVRKSLRDAVEQHQLQKLREQYSTPGNPIGAEKVETKEDDKFDHKMKLILVGDSGVGKTGLMKRYLFDTFDYDTMSTIGIDFGVAKERLSDESIMKLNIWDTGGQERYRSIATGFFRDADVIIVCYGIDNKQSFTDCGEWRTVIEENACKEDVRILLVGCKADVQRKGNGRGLCREVDISSARELAQSAEWKRFNTQWCECSAKTGEKVVSVLKTAAELGLQQILNRGETEQVQPAHDRINLSQRVQAPAASQSWSCWC